MGKWALSEFKDVLGLIFRFFSDAVDVKDLQYTIVKSRREAVTLITDIYTAEAKSVIKTLKEIETRPINAELSYKPINLQKISSGQLPMQPRVSKMIVIQE